MNADAIETSRELAGMLNQHRHTVTLSAEDHERLRSLSMQWCEPYDSLLAKGLRILDEVRSGRARLVYGDG